MLLGVVLANLVNWLLGGERSLALAPPAQPLLLLRRKWISRCLLVGATTAMTLIAIYLLGWTGNQVLITVMVLNLVSNRQALLRKGLQRIAGPILGAGWGLGSAILITRVEHIAVALALFYLRMFIAGYLARVSTAQPYAGVQMGFVIALVLVAPPDQSGNMGLVAKRIESALVGLDAAPLVSSIWPTIRPAQTA
jgi:hypothetical protein